MDLLRWLVSRNPPCPRDARACAVAAYGGHMTILQWLRSNDFPWDEGTPAGAASSGSLEMLQWLRSEGCPWDERTCTAATGVQASGLGGRREEMIFWFCIENLILCTIRSMPSPVSPTCYRYATAAMPKRCPMHLRLLLVVVGGKLPLRTLVIEGCRIAIDTSIATGNDPAAAARMLKILVRTAFLPPPRRH
jgi:hypothetical protein